MKTYIECIPCFFNQAINTAKRLNLDDGIQKRIINEICREVMRFPLTCTPPEMGHFIYSSIKKMTGNPDPFKDIKEKSNKMAKGILTSILKNNEKISDKLAFAIKLSAAGNIIDFGIPGKENPEKEVKEILKKDFKIFHYDALKESLKNSKKLLYLTDNAGEIVFDKFLIEQIKEIYPIEITLAVRGAPIINDATIKDAEECGLTDIVKVIQNGYDAPGTVLSHCSKEFLRIYEKTDIIISKGQGNFESLEGNDKEIFFIFCAKCKTVAKHINSSVGDIVLIKNKRNKKNTIDNKDSL